MAYQTLFFLKMFQPYLGYQLMAILIKVTVAGDKIFIFNIIIIFVRFPKRMDTYL